MSTANHKTYPCIFIRKSIIFPFEKVPLVLEGKETIETVNRALQTENHVVISFQKNGEISEIGLLGKVIQFWNLTLSSAGIIVEGKDRVKILRTYTENNLTLAEIELIGKQEKNSNGLEAIARSVFEKFRALIKLEGSIPMYILDEIQKNRISPENLSYLVAATIRLDFKAKLDLMENLEVKRNLETLNLHLAKELEIMKAEKRIQAEVDKELNKTQKEFVLRERMKAIEKELGVYEEYKEFDQLEKKIKKSEMPAETEKVAFKELSRLKSIPSMSAELPYIRSYLDWLTDLPWNTRSETFLDLQLAEKVLDQDHYGLRQVKERLLDYLAVQKLTSGRGRATIICFVGPPGTGKTSVGKSIARALDRKFCRVSLGGIHDEAEIRGHRRTYVGALPGRIIQGIRNAGTKNPIFMLDEIDKIGTDFRGDPGAALLEVLDPEQNNAFSDHYLEVPFDLSEVFFITTANVIDSIPPTLLDRMEVIEFFGYTEEEKFNIAKRFLLPQVLKDAGLTSKVIALSNNAIKKIIIRYTREAGVRNLERKLAEIARKVARKFAEKKALRKISINEENLADYLGPEEFSFMMSEARDEVGICTGLAWTPAGGQIISVEAAIFPGRGGLTLTGQLGKVIQESAKAALSYLRSRSKQLKIDLGLYERSDIHVHVPSGAIPKDGPSAGIAIATALASILTHKKVRKEVALTGEITLSGKVLEVSGIKEKVLAAHRAGAKIVVMPKNNKKNLVDVPEDIKKKLTFKFVSHMDEVLKSALK